MTGLLVALAVISAAGAIMSALYAGRSRGASASAALCAHRIADVYVDFGAPVYTGAGAPAAPHPESSASCAFCGTMRPASEIEADPLTGLAACMDHTWCRRTRMVSHDR